MEGVQFAYSAFDSPVFSNLSLHIRDGEHVAITGPSGSGKSTIAKLLVGAVKAKAGAVCVCGMELNDSNEDMILQHVATVMQDDHLITGSILENIDFFRGSSMESVVHAAESAEIAAFIRSLPMKYETQISDEFGGAIRRPAATNPARSRFVRCAQGSCAG